MLWLFPVYLIVVFVASMSSLVLAASAWQRRFDSEGSRAYAALMWSIFAWIIARSLVLISNGSLEWAGLWDAVSLALESIISAVYLIFVLHYTGRDRWLTSG